MSAGKNLISMSSKNYRIKLEFYVSRTFQYLQTLLKFVMPSKPLDQSLESSDMLLRHLLNSLMSTMLNKHLLLLTISDLKLVLCGIFILQRKSILNQHKSTQTRTRPSRRISLQRMTNKHSENSYTMANYHQLSQKLHRLL